MLRIWLKVCAATIAAAWVAAHAEESAQRISGEVVAIDGAMLQMKSHTGESMTIKLADNVTFSARSKADIAKITAGAFVGTTAIPQPDGTLKATEVHVFPEAMRGTGEGHHPADSTPGSTMTNATVTNVGKRSSGGSTMTNASVANLAESGGAEAMKLTYKGGEQTVVIPAGTPIMMMERGDRSLLVPGAHIVVTTRKQLDGTLTSDRLIVGKDGFVPPP
jgi:hypothetical protein